MRKVKDDFANDRAVEIYEWVLIQSGTFRSRDIPKWDKSNLNRLAMKSLIDRDLVRMIGHEVPRSYRLSRIVEPSTCLDIPDNVSHYTGVKRYRVHPSIAVQHAKDPDLQQYAIS